MENKTNEKAVPAFSLVLEETKENLAVVINSSHLPPAVVVYILRDLLAEADHSAKLQYQKDLAKAQEQKQERKKGESESDCV